MHTCILHNIWYKTPQGRVSSRLGTYTYTAIYYSRFDYVTESCDGMEEKPPPEEGEVFLHPDALRPARATASECGAGGPDAICMHETVGVVVVAIPVTYIIFYTYIVL